MKIAFYYLIYLCIIAVALGEKHRRHLNFEKCLAHVATGKLFGPHFNNAILYEKLNFQQNNIFDKAYPIAIFTPSSTSDVQSAVKCGVKTNIQLVPISGGHSYAGLSSGTNNSILIDFRLMNNILIDPKEKTVTVESGVMLGSLHLKLWKNGGFGAPIGACTTVALGGLAIGGGIGYFSSRFGLTIDNLVQINMVDAIGNDIVVDKTHNVDLWWAMRGVGPGYIGLVTSVKMNVYPAKKMKLASLIIRFHNRHFKKVMESYIKWLDWVKENDPSINSVVIVRSDEYKSNATCGNPEVSGTFINILQYPGQKRMKEGTPHFVKAALDIFGDFYSLDLSFPNYMEFLEKYIYTPEGKYCEAKTIDQKLDFFSSFTRDMYDSAYFLARSFFVKKRYTAERFNEAQNILLKMPASGGLYINSEQGAIHDRQSNETAYVHRDALFSFKVFLRTGIEAEVKPSTDWLKSFYNSVKFMDSGETYQAYPERNMKDYLQRYYGTNLERLVDIKSKWDPNHYFNSMMSLPITLSAKNKFAPEN